MAKIDRPKRQPTGSYEVGFCRTPEETRFKPGQCGNPHGRRGDPNKPRPALDAGAILDGSVAVTQGGRRRRMSRREAELRQQVKNALRGDLRAIRHVLDVFDKYGALAASPRPAGSSSVFLVPNTMPEELGTALYLVYGPRVWTRKEIAIGRNHYLNNRTERQRERDRTADYPVLRGLEDR